MLNFWTLGSLSGAVGVACGALGAHFIKNWTSPALTKAWETAAHYQILHAIPLLLIGYSTRRELASSGYLFLSGSILFSGSIYGLVLFPDCRRVLGPVTPIGGLLLLGGWLTLLINRP